MEGRGQNGGTRGETGRDRDRTDKRGKCVAVKKEAKELRHPASPPCTCVQSGQLRVCGGRQVAVHVMANRRLHSKRKKRKALATHHLFFYQSNNLQKEGSPHFWQVPLWDLAIEISQLQSAEVLTKHHLPLLSPRLQSSGTAAATGISRTDHGAFTVRKSQPPPSRNPRSDSWSHFSWPNVWLPLYEKQNTAL